MFNKLFCGLKHCKICYKSKIDYVPKYYGVKVI